MSLATFFMRKTEELTTREVPPTMLDLGIVESLVKGFLDDSLESGFLPRCVTLDCGCKALVEGEVLMNSSIDKERLLEMFSGFIKSDCCGYPSQIDDTDPNQERAFVETHASTCELYRICERHI